MLGVEGLREQEGDIEGVALSLKKDLWNPKIVSYLCFSSLAGFGVGMNILLMHSPEAMLMFNLMFSMAMFLTMVNRIMKNNIDQARNAPEDMVGQELSKEPSQRSQKESKVDEDIARVDSSAGGEKLQQEPSSALKVGYSISSIMAMTSIRLAVRLSAQKPLTDLLANVMSNSNATFVAMVISRYVGRLVSYISKIASNAEEFQEGKEKAGQELLQGLVKESVVSAMWIGSLFAVINYTAVGSMPGIEGIMAITAVGVTAIIASELIYQSLAYVLSNDTEKKMPKVKDVMGDAAKLSLDFLIFEGLTEAGEAMEVARLGNELARGLASAGVGLMRAGGEALYTHLLYCGPLDELASSQAANMKQSTRVVFEGARTVMRNAIASLQAARSTQEPSL